MPEMTMKKVIKESVLSIYILNLENSDDGHSFSNNLLTQKRYCIGSFGI